MIIKLTGENTVTLLITTYIYVYTMQCLDVSFLLHAPFKISQIASLKGTGRPSPTRRFQAQQGQKYTRPPHDFW